MSGTRRKPGRLGPFVEGYSVWLLEAGYTPQTVRGMLRVLGQLGRWMASEGVGVGESTALRSRRSWLRCALAVIAGCPVFARFARWRSICERSA